LEGQARPDPGGLIPSRHDEDAPIWERRSGRGAMKYFVFGPTYVVRLDPGEKIAETLTALCERDKIGGGYLSGIGSAGEAEIGWFDALAKGYVWSKVAGPSEIVSLTGNVTKVDGRPFVHAHVALAGKDLIVKGGHLKEAVVAVTCEIILVAFKDDLARKKDEASGFLKIALEPDED
jgi:predicted DNA-binding protein with PD1-like motif